MAPGSGRGKSSRFQGEQDLWCFPLKLLANSESRMDPCSLHIALGLVVNAMGGSMLRRTGEAIVRSVLYGPANITIKSL